MLATVCSYLGLVNTWIAWGRWVHPLSPGWWCSIPFETGRRCSPRSCRTAPWTRWTGHRWRPRWPWGGRRRGWSRAPSSPPASTPPPPTAASQGRRTRQRQEPTISLSFTNWQMKKPHLVFCSLASCDKDTPAPLKLNIKASVVSTALQHWRSKRPVSSL